ncbi:unnamed protein product [Prorocentrum cordatum]|uniref:Uncharacterized protein n=1 Tax=Prorocentrum cordatum TaxID=2364126 RepID=A0ABN9S322_9DINO|nr:unnamed protein product [Polarella glacialis]
MLARDAATQTALIVRHFDVADGMAMDGFDTHEYKKDNFPGAAVLGVAGIHLLPVFLAVFNVKEVVLVVLPGFQMEGVALVMLGNMFLMGVNLCMLLRVASAMTMIILPIVTLELVLTALGICLPAFQLIQADGVPLVGVVDIRGVGGPQTVVVFVVVIFVFVIFLQTVVPIVLAIFLLLVFLMLAMVPISLLGGIVVLISLPVFLLGLFEVLAWAIVMLTFVLRIFLAIFLPIFAVLFFMLGRFVLQAVVPMFLLLIVRMARRISIVLGMMITLVVQSFLRRVALIFLSDADDLPADILVTLAEDGAFVPDALLTEYRPRLKNKF